MISSTLDVIVIGAGQAGLSIGYYLKNLGLGYIILEKSKIGDTWRTQRWDSFKLNTPNRVNSLPGWENAFSDEEGFCSSSEFICFLENYTRTFQLPVVEECPVLSVESDPELKFFSICAAEKGSITYYRSKQLVVASGAQNKKIIPIFAGNITAEVHQLHAGEYRSASLLPDGAVLIVGSGQSGVQIAEDLISNGKNVFISTSQVGRVPRRYRGKDIVDWLILSGFYDMKTADVTDAQILAMKQPQISNTGLRGHTLSLQGLARNGAVILGKTENAYGTTVFLQPNAAGNIRFADDTSKRMKMMIDEFIQRSQLYAPMPEDDPEDDPDETAEYATTITALNLKENNITSIIWTTGFSGDFSYLKLPILNNAGLPRHQEGISDFEGLFFMGHPWLRKRKSGIILGIEEDAEFIAEKLLANHRI